MAKKKHSALTEIWDPSKDFLDRCEDVVRQIKEIDFSKRTDNQLRVFAQWIRNSIKQGDDPNAHLIPAFALAREAGKRAIGLTAYDCQLYAGIALYEGRLAEMYTGEGKTLAAVMPAVLHALAGHQVHILNFND